MVKFVLIGWACVLYADNSQQCVRMVSEVIHTTLESCMDYNKIIEDQVADVNDVLIDMKCISTGVIEDYVLTIS